LDNSVPSAGRIAFNPAIDPKNRRLDANVVIAIGLIHLACIAAPFCFTWSGLVLMLFLWWFTGAIGITLCFHRLLTHRSFQTPKWFEHFLAIVGCLNWQGGPMRWVGTHRLHHRDSDTECDPHTPRHGFTWAHMLWPLYHDNADFKPYDAVKDLQRDPVMMKIEKYFFLPQFILMPILFGLGYLYGQHFHHAPLDHTPLFFAFSWLIWGVAVRTTVGYHGTWFVNSASHVWGYKNFNTHDDSKNNWWVAVLSFGEGWHNNHHAQQRSAAHGMKWWEFDLTWNTILVLSWFGLATKIVRPKLPTADKVHSGANNEAAVEMPAISAE